MGKQLRHHPGAVGRSLRRQLVDGKPPLHEGKHPLSVKVRDDGDRRQPLARQTMQRIGIHLELGLALEGDTPYPQESGFSIRTLPVYAESCSSSLRR